MLRRICTLMFLLIAYTAFAAPAPKSGWERLDPDKDCKIDIKDGTVTIELPGGDHELDPKRKRFNAPRLLRDVEGDFDIQVRIRASFHTSAKSSVEGQEPRVAASLVLITADINYIQHEYGAYPRKGKRDNGFTYRMLGEQLAMSGGMEWKPGDWEPVRRADEEQVYLRLERQGNCIRLAVSSDGKTWIRNISLECNIPSKLKVGLAACSTSTEPFKVRFDQFKLIRSPKKKP